MRVTKNHCSIYGGVTKGVNAKKEKKNNTAETANEIHPSTISMCMLYFGGLVKATDLYLQHYIKISKSIKTQKAIDGTNISHTSTPLAIFAPY